MEPPSFQPQNSSSRKRSKNSDSTPNNNFNQNNSNQNNQQNNNLNPGFSQNNNYNPNNTFTPTNNFQQNDQNNSNFYQPNNQNNFNQNTSNQNQQPNLFQPGGNNMAMNLASNFADQYKDQYKEAADKYIDKYIDAKSLKLYFQVDTNYVLKKLQLLLVPYIHKEWSVQNLGSNNQPRTPKEDLNVPDLYIPFMGLLTYVLLVGIKVGQDQHFTPDQLGASLSTGLGWIIFEVMIVSFVMYLISLRTDMKTYDVVSYLGYKFVPVCALMITCVFFSSSFYWPIFLFTSSSLAFFIAKTMSLKIRAKGNNVTDENYGSADHHAQAHSKTQYVTWAIAAVQPMLVWILTYSFT